MEGRIKIAIQRSKRHIEPLPQRDSTNPIPRRVKMALVTCVSVSGRIYPGPSLTLVQFLHDCLLLHFKSLSYTKR